MHFGGFGSTKLISAHESKVTVYLRKAGLDSLGRSKLATGRGHVCISRNKRISLGSRIRTFEEPTDSSSFFQTFFPDTFHFHGANFKGTVRPDWICMRVVSLKSPLKGHQPLYVYNFFIFDLEFLKQLQSSEPLHPKRPLILLLVRFTVCMCSSRNLFSSNRIP